MVKVIPNLKLDCQSDLFQSLMTKVIDFKNLITKVILDQKFNSHLDCLIKKKKKKKEETKK